MVTSRAVKEGEELCDNYGVSWGGGQGWKERRKALAAEFGFTCCCVACDDEQREEAYIGEDIKENVKKNKAEESEEAKLVSLSDMRKEHKKVQELSWKDGNLRLEIGKH